MKQKVFVNKGCSGQAAGPGVSCVVLLHSLLAPLPFFPVRDPDQPGCLPLGVWSISQSVCRAGLPWALRPWACLSLWVFGVALEWPVGAGFVRKELPAGASWWEEVEAQITSLFREVRFLPDFSPLALAWGREALYIPIRGYLISSGTLRNYMEAYSAVLSTPVP